MEKKGEQRAISSRLSRKTIFFVYIILYRLYLIISCIIRYIFIISFISLLCLFCLYYIISFRLYWYIIQYTCCIFREILCKIFYRYTSAYVGLKFGTEIRIKRGYSDDHAFIFQSRCFDRLKLLSIVCTYTGRTGDHFLPK